MIFKTMMRTAMERRVRKRKRKRKRKRTAMERRVRTRKGSFYKLLNRRSSERAQIKQIYALRST